MIINNETLEVLKMLNDEEIKEIMLALVRGKELPDDADISLKVIFMLIENQREELKKRIAKQKSKQKSNEV